MLVGLLQYWMAGSWRDPADPLTFFVILDTDGAPLAIGDHVSVTGVVRSFTYIDPQNAMISVLSDIPDNVPSGVNKAFFVSSLCVVKI
jgi:hypothetical protein